MVEQHMPGLSVAVVRGGKLAKVASYGWSDLERCVPATGDSVFGIGSVSKQFTAAGILVLVNEGKLSLDDPIVKYLPEGKSAWQEIKIRHLLTHTSGIKDYCDDDHKFASMTLDRTTNTPTRDLVAMIAQAPVNFRAGDDWAYSNTGYLLLSVIAERVSGTPFPEFMREKVFAPVGMVSTRYYSPRQLIPNLAVPYHVDREGRITHGDYISDQFSRWGDMGMVSTVRDMAKWTLAMNSDVPFPRSMWQQMKTPVRLNDGSVHQYGFGLQVFDSNGIPIVGHGGSFRVGYTSLLLTFPSNGLAFVSLSNFLGEGSPHESLARAIVAAADSSIVLPAPKSTPGN
jgi:CubicO group peptidase (beta-lactamase class C family)